ncbi:MAG: glycosyltransferase family 2 protein [Paludibacter sp.]|nr:glycosyltransferase family 2 protein [Paludibacter sp.]
MNRIAVLITCYNRKDKTLKCLSHLFNQDISVDVFLVDDGCTDGTGEAVKESYPSVHVILGDGSLFWNRGMYTAWCEAEKFDYDFYLWLNDDTYIFSNSLAMMLESSTEKNHKALIVGASCDSNDQTVTSFGADWKSKALFPNGALQQCDAFGGNFVLIPRYVYKKCGKLDYYYRHSLGDIDYARHVVSEGIEIFLAPKHIGICVNDFKTPKYLEKSLTLKERLRVLHSPLSYSDPRDFFYFYKKHEGVLSASLHLTSIYLKFLIKSL